MRRRTRQPWRARRSSRASFPPGYPQRLSWPRGPRCEHETLLTREGPPPLAASDATALTLLTQPIVAVLLGAAFGVASLLVSRASSRLVTPDDPALGFAKLVVISLMRLLFVLGALTAYYVWARAALVPFGIALIVGFFATLTYELFTVGRPTHRVGTQGGR